ncbi:hypothetical protein [Sphingobacterium sp. JUb56]|uniref:hypothetical protein n=1 Tax=Sphingobacterium sp. JUb56 TaxID=2587145 RepID=UPI0016144624|nr:hypothetical protein [Sphingobacterium sp. JUb56]MBB2950731.1 hypothetical protein [Sphingobacterium sp. JUb56]
MGAKLRDFDVLKCVEGNLLMVSINEFIEQQIDNYDQAKDLYKNLALFRDRFLEITYISTLFHDSLLDKENFIDHKHNLKSSQEHVGLLLLPETLYSDFSFVDNVDETEFPMDAILYSWSNVNRHDKLLSEYDQEDHHVNEDDRYLYILPIFGNATTVGSNRFEMTNIDDQFLTPYDHQDGRTWYGKIHDYVMAFIIAKNQPHNEFFINSVNLKDHSSNSILVQEDIFSY